MTTLDNCNVEFTAPEVADSTAKNHFVPYSIVLESANLDNDGDLDITVQVSSNKDIYIYLNDDGSFTTRQFVATGDFMWHTKLKDYDGDGFTDILLLKDGNVVVYKNQFAQ